MSLLPYALYTTVSNSTPLLDPNLSISFSNQSINNSTINTSRIFLDGNYLDTTGSGSNAALLINGIPITGGNTSSATSSITANWSFFPAISTISYATSAGSGGNIIMCNVSTLTANTGTHTAQVGTVNSLTVSSINSQPYPLTIGSPILTGSQQMSGAVLVVPINFAGQAAGLYFVYASLQQPGDEMSAACVVQFSGSAVLGGSLHAPNVGASGVSFNNYVSFQQDASQVNSILKILIYSQAYPNKVVQYGVQRIL